MGKNYFIQSKKILAKSSFFILLYFVFVPSLANAAEINPAPGTYGYGSTSEYSASTSNLEQTNTPLTPSPTPTASKVSTLASTGDPTTLIKFVAIALIACGIGGLVIFLRKKNSSR